MQNMADTAQQQIDAIDDQIANARNSQERAELEAQRARPATEHGRSSSHYRRK